MPIAGSVVIVSSRVLCMFYMHLIHWSARPATAAYQLYKQICNFHTGICTFDTFRQFSSSRACPWHWQRIFTLTRTHTCIHTGGDIDIHGNSGSCSCSCSCSACWLCWWNCCRILLWIIINNSARQRKRQRQYVHMCACVCTCVCALRAVAKGIRCTSAHWLHFGVVFHFVSGLCCCLHLCECVCALWIQ